MLAPKHKLRQFCLNMSVFRGVRSVQSRLTFFHKSSVLCKCYSSLSNLMYTSTNGSFFINGEFKETTEASHDTFPIINPATEEVLTKVPIANETDVQDACQAARTAFDSGIWSDLSGSERASYMHSLATLVRDNKERLAQLETLNMGKPYMEAIWDVEDVANCFDYYADLARNLDLNLDESVDVGDPEWECKITKMPLGVVAAVSLSLILYMYMYIYILI